MKRITLVALCAVGLVVVFTLLAFAVYSPQFTVTDSHATIPQRPVQIDTGATTDTAAPIDVSSDAPGQVNASEHHLGTACGRDTTADVGY